MKTIIQLLSLFLFFTLNIQAKAQQSLDEIESKIQQTFGASFQAQSNQVQVIANQLVEAYQKNQDHDYAYWAAYARYQSGLYFLVQEDMAQSQTEVEKAIEILDAIKDKNAEDHVLLGTLLSLSITFSPGKAMGLSGKANRHYQKALEQDPNNMRAHLAIGRSDFYKPTQYGGGKLVEKHLLQALSLPTSSSDAPNAPSWGRDEAFHYLAQFYQREDRIQEAIAYCQRGLKEFPYHFGLKQLLEQLQ